MTVFRNIFQMGKVQKFAYAFLAFFGITFGVQTLVAGSDRFYRCPGIQCQDASGSLVFYGAVTLFIVCLLLFRFRYFLFILVFSGVIFAAPLAYQHLRADIQTPRTAEQVDAVLVFGAIVRNGVISPLHKQRLDAGIAMLEQGKTEKIVVSNSLRAATFMYKYLIDQGVPEAVIEIDGNATHTPLTCASELRRDTSRRVAFISQTFHLPRLAYQCRRLGLQGQLITADGPTEADLWTKVRIRTTRHAREAALLWGAILNLYPE